MPDGAMHHLPIIRSPADLPPGTPLRIVRARGRGERVIALLAKDDGVAATQDGQRIPYRAGEHYLVDYPSGARQVVRRDIFEKTYRRTRSGAFRKNTDIRYRAAIATTPLQVETLEGPRTAHAGDWIMIGVADEMWPVPAAEATRKYKGVPAVGMTGVATTIGLVFVLLAFVAWVST